MSAEEELRRLRGEMREITERIVDLLIARLKKAEEIGKIKSMSGLPKIDRKTERELREAVERKAAEHGIEPERVRRVLSLLMQESLKSQSAAQSQRITHMDIFRKAKRMELEGREIIHLEVGEPDFGAPPPVAEGLTKAAKNGFAMYGEAKGRMELRSAIREFLEARFGVDVKEDNIVVTPGGRFAIFLAAASTLSPGDEAVVIDPSWPMYKQTIESLYARALVHHTVLENGWRPDLAALDELTSDGARALLINYPNNPTGITIGERELGEIIELCRRRGTYLISDEVYMDYSFGKFTSSLEFGYERTIMIMSFSKSWGMTGYRIGFLVADRPVADKAAKLQAMLMTNVPEFIQISAISALRDKETPAKYRDAMRERIEAVCRFLDEAGAAYARPGGGMYVFPRLSIEGGDAAEFALRLLDEEGVSIAPGSAFGEYPSFVRISTGVETRKILLGMERIKEALRRAGA